MAGQRLYSLSVQIRIINVPIGKLRASDLKQVPRVRFLDALIEI
jgi:hypothetical protein